MKKERTNRLKKTSSAARVLFVVLMLGTTAFAEGSNGTLDFIFSPENDWTQFSLWIEDGNGDYVGTVYVTDFIGRRGGGNRTSETDIDLSNGNRLSALPIWAYKRGVIDSTFGIDNYYPPAETKPSYPADIDAVSGATPHQGIQTKTYDFTDLPDGEYNCWIEAGKSFNFNQFHNYSFYRGQPSVVWNLKIVVGDFADSALVLGYCGYGSPDGSDGEIKPPDSTITTAVDLLRDLGGYKFKVVYTPGPAVIKDDGGSSSSVGFVSLGQNYPNPFNTVTGIEYFLTKGSHVNLAIYNMLGEKLIVPVDEHQTAGSKRVWWDGRDSKGMKVANGIYFYKLQAGEDSRTKMMIVLK